MKFTELESEKMEMNLSSGWIYKFKRYRLSGESAHANIERIISELRILHKRILEC